MQSTKRERPPWDAQAEAVEAFIKAKTTALPGEPPILPTMLPFTVEDGNGQMWRYQGHVSPPDALRHIRRGANLWITEEGSWPPMVVPAECADELFSMLAERWNDVAGWVNKVPSEFEQDCVIQIWKKQKEKKKPPKRRKGEPLEQVSLLVRTFW